MSSIDAEGIRAVRRFTSAGIADCKAALDRCDGNTYEAIRQLLTVEEILEMHRSVMIRNIAPESMKDPPTPSEIALIERLYREVMEDQPESRGRNEIRSRRGDPDSEQGDKPKPWWRFW